MVVKKFCVPERCFSNVPMKFMDFYINETPVCVSKQGFRNLILTMTYSHMGKPHTTIGDASFHC
ncbi:hypothetical protein PspCFBP13509_21895 [Pseudomonas sp. CFBP13509]|nr:hypothetical protein PspCFBP13509_21895 [Pseudomonas sp. CFBP13509]